MPEKAFLSNRSFAKGDMPPYISSISCHFLHLEAVSQTKYCCSRSKYFALLFTDHAICVPDV